MLTCDSSEFLEGWHTNSLALRLLVVPQKRRKALQRGSVKNSLGRDANQHFFPKQNLQQLFRAGLLDSQLRKNLFRQGRRQTGFCERLLDLLFGTLFFERQGDSRAGFLYELRVQYQFFLLHERFKRGPERFWPHALSEADSQLFSRDAGQERVLLVEALHTSQQFFANVGKGVFGEHNERFERDDTDLLCQS